MEFTALRWQSFEQIMAFSHKILKQRYFIVRFTLYMLSVMAGIGWVNAAANMIQSRRKEYVVLRKLGMSEGRVKKINMVPACPVYLFGDCSRYSAWH